jgi:hypothetical protein
MVPLICITGYRDRLMGLLDKYTVTVSERPLDQDVVQYTIEGGDNRLLEELSPLQYIPLEVAIPVTEAMLASSDFPTQLAYAKELLTVLIARILGAVVRIVDYRLEDLLFLSPLVIVPEGEVALYRSRWVVTNFKSQIDPNLLLKYRVINPHPLSILALEENNNIEKRYLSDIPLTPADSESLTDLESYLIDNRTKALQEEGWRVTLGDRDKVPILEMLGPVKTIELGTRLFIFYRPDPHLLLSSNWISRPDFLTIVGDWMNPPISDTVIGGGGAPSPNPVGTVSGVVQDRSPLVTEITSEREQWNRYRARLFWNSLPFDGWISPTLSLVVHTSDKWRDYLEAMKRPIDKVVATPFETIEEANYSHSHLAAGGVKSYLIPGNFDFSNPKGYYLLTEGSVIIPRGKMKVT